MWPVCSGRRACASDEPSAVDHDSTAWRVCSYHRIGKPTQTCPRMVCISCFETYFQVEYTNKNYSSAKPYLKQTHTHVYDIYLCANFFFKPAARTNQGPTTHWCSDLAQERHISPRFCTPRTLRVYTITKANRRQNKQKQS